jgi:hypothetical protein
LAEAEEGPGAKDWQEDQGGIHEEVRRGVDLSDALSGFPSEEFLIFFYREPLRERAIFDAQMVSSMGSCF